MKKDISLGKITARLVVQWRDIIYNDRWMQTKTHDVLIEARKLRERLNAARFEDFTPNPDYDADAHVAEIRRDRDRDHWDEV